MREISEVVGISTGAVRVRIFRAVRRLRLNLESEGQQDWRSFAGKSGAAIRSRYTHGGSTRLKANQMRPTRGVRGR